MNIKSLLTLIVGCIAINASFGQNMKKYSAFTSEASRLYKAKEYKQSAEKYKKAFDTLDGKAYPNDRYNAACAYALSNNLETAFYHLYYLAENKKIKFRDLQQITTDTDLENLRSERKWKALVEIVAANKKEYEKDLDKPLMDELSTIYELDQKYRAQIDEIEKKYGRDSDEMKIHWKLINDTDAENLVKVKKILDERGWLGSKVVGDQGNSALFLVIQHASIDTQVQYLPMMREAVKLGNARASSLALLEDRVALRQGKRQIYGSQIGTDQETGASYVSPLIEPEKVNERRASVGLGTIEEYVQYFDMTWDLEKHKERTRKIESKKKQ